MENNKLHISELTKYVVKQRDLIDDFRPSFGNKINNKITKKDKLLIKKLMKKLSIKDIVSMIKKNKDIPKKEIYNYCIQIKNEN